MAFYYMWYGNPTVSKEWKGWNHLGNKPDKGSTCTADKPIKLYDSNDKKVIRNHIKTALKNGIDTLIASYWGAEISFSKPFNTLLKEASKTKIKITPYIETLHNHVESAIDELNNLLDILTKEKSILTINTKPVIFIYTRAIKQFNKKEWAEIISGLKTKPVIIADINNKELLSLFNGAHNYCPLHAYLMRKKADKHYKGIINECRKQGKITTYTVMPGYDDRVLKRKHSIKYRLWQLAHLSKKEFYVDRKNGKTYTELWNQALKINPDFVLITTFNEWHEGTEIEPSREYGDFYLKLTKDYSDKFKRQHQMKKEQ
ncbi:MAG TPA: glycoside hydrolase family 99-like domain-containing protein [Candidatus Nanoarchaeia archaeon]|nr:glycoside hydrolase family 99-like domain-containing protein [Candidatus Nanoarchaeia archaeon]